jgi:hypothetical protein
MTKFYRRQNPLRLIDLADALGVVPSMVTKLKGAGMPTDSLSDALAWRLKNQIRPGTRSSLR